MSTPMFAPTLTPNPTLATKIVKVRPDIMKQIFGKDVVDVIYRELWKMQIRELNTQYIDSVYDELDAPIPKIVFKSKSNCVWFNYRSPVNLFSSYQVYSFVFVQGFWKARRKKQRDDLTKGYW